MDEDPQIACELLRAVNLSVDGCRRQFGQATVLHGGTTERNARAFIPFRVCTKCQVVVTGSDMGKCGVIVAAHTPFLLVLALIAMKRPSAIPIRDRRSQSHMAPPVRGCTST